MRSTSSPCSTTLYRKIQAATFPPRYKLAERCCGWRESHVNIWLHNPMTFTIADLPDEPE
ncbi:hypothetical protein GCM10011393_25880 [Sphingopyxis bauzanensis]|nr:hypothetical protein GCM10011393_25880 [Sphingopyxis bauzanensis]